MLGLKDYNPHIAQQAFHMAVQMYQYIAMICGIRGGKTYSGAREAGRLAWNSPYLPPAAFCIIAPTYSMLDRTTWAEFKVAMAPFIKHNSDTRKVLTLKNNRLVYGFSAEDPDKIRNVTASGFWIDEARECKNFANLWQVMQGRVLSTRGKGIVTTSPNSFDDVHDIFIGEKRRPEYGVIRFSTYDNTYLSKEAIDTLASQYDTKFAQQELGGQFVLFEGAVYYTFNRLQNAGQLAMKLALYDPMKPIALCCDFNVDPMAWVVTQSGVRPSDGLKEVYAIDELVIRNANTWTLCKEFSARYPNHRAGLMLYGDATGHARHSDSNVTNWKIIQEELKKYSPQMYVPSSNPAERDRVNAVNGMICNSKGDRRVFVHPNRCKKLIRDLEQVSYKEGSVQIDKTKDLQLTHPSDAFGYYIEKEFSLNRGKIEGLKI